MSSHKPSFRVATEVLRKLLEGKTSKEIQFELDISPTTVSQVKEMFPLFLGLPRLYNRSNRKP